MSYFVEVWLCGDITAVTWWRVMWWYNGLFQSETVSWRHRCETANLIGCGCIAPTVTSVLWTLNPGSSVFCLLFQARCFVIGFFFWQFLIPLTLVISLPLSGWFSLGIKVDLRERVVCTAESASQCKALSSQWRPPASLSSWLNPCRFVRQGLSVFRCHQIVFLSLIAASTCSTVTVRLLLHIFVWLSRTCWRLLFTGCGCRHLAGPRNYAHTDSRDLCVRPVGRCGCDTWAVPVDNCPALCVGWVCSEQVFTVFRFDISCHMKCSFVTFDNVIWCLQQVWGLFGNIFYSHDEFLLAWPETSVNVIICAFDVEDFFMLSFCSED